MDEAESTRSARCTARSWFILWIRCAHGAGGLPQSCSSYLSRRKRQGWQQPRASAAYVPVSKRYWMNKNAPTACNIGAPWLKLQASHLTLLMPCPVAFYTTQSQLAVLL